jgi:hypothetical protein
MNLLKNNRAGLCGKQITVTHNGQKVSFIVRMGNLLAIVLLLMMNDNVNINDTI